jgi:hypothetical protein
MSTEEENAVQGAVVEAATTDAATTPSCQPLEIVKEEVRSELPPPGDVVVQDPTLTFESEGLKPTPQELDENILKVPVVAAAVEDIAVEEAVHDDEPVENIATENAPANPPEIAPDTNKSESGQTQASQVLAESITNVTTTSSITMTDQPTTAIEASSSIETETIATRQRRSAAKKSNKKFLLFVW